MRGKNVRVVLSLNAIIYEAVAAEAEAWGFSPSEIVNRALLGAGYGKAAVKAAEKAAEKAAAKAAALPVVQPFQWSDETNEMYAMRRRVENWTGTTAEEALVRHAYQQHGYDDIVYCPMPRT